MVLHDAECVAMSISTPLHWGGRPSILAKSTAECPRAVQRGTGAGDGWWWRAIPEMTPWSWFKEVVV